MIVEELLKTTVAELEKLVSAERIMSEARTFGDVTVIPVCKIGFGFGAAGGSGKGCSKAGKDEGSGEGGGGGAGGGVHPVAVVVVKAGDVTVLPLKSKGSIASIAESLGDMLPELLEKATELKKAKKEEKQQS